MPQRKVNKYGPFKGDVLPSFYLFKFLQISPLLICLQFTIIGSKVSVIKTLHCYQKPEFAPGSSKNAKNPRIFSSQAKVKVFV
jgi:hypothetical protein